MARSRKAAGRRSARPGKLSRHRHTSKKDKDLQANEGTRKHGAVLADPHAKQQLKLYEGAIRYFRQQKLHKAKQAFEKVRAGPSKELADRALVHQRICEQRMARPPTPTLRTADQHYHHGVAMMNLGHWDEAREHLLRALKLSPKAEYVYYAVAALDCLTGEADSALENLKVAIDFRPENRYRARNDDDFAFLQEDPRFTELLYPEREGSAD